MNDLELDDLVRAEVLRRTEAAPVPHRFDELDQRPEAGVQPMSPLRGRRSLAVAAAVIVVLASVAGWWAANRGGDVEVAATGISVLHEVTTYEQSVDLDCADIGTSGRFDELTIEVWGSPELERWRQVITYPDGSTASLLVSGSPYYPTKTITDGIDLGRTVECRNGIGQAAPSIEALTSLNPMAPVPVAPGGGSAVPSYADLGEQVAGEHRTSDGTPAELWRHLIDGFLESGNRSARLVQTEEWLVEPGTRTVLERSFSQQADGIGTVGYRLRLVEFAPVTVPPDFFDSDELSPPGRSPSETTGEPVSMIEVDPLAEPGTASIWPAVPRDESPSDLAARFAEFLGWDGVTVNAKQDGSGPAWVTIDHDEGSPIDVLTIPSRLGRVIVQIAPLGLSATVEPGGRPGLDVWMPASAITADFYVNDGTRTQAWTADGPFNGPVVVPRAIGRIDVVLVLGRDGDGRVTAVAGADFRD